MRSVIEDNTVALAALRRLEEEVAELRDAVENRGVANVVDEITDVVHCTRSVLAACGLSEQVVRDYGKIKSALRDFGIRNKGVELRLAAEFAHDSTL